MQFGSIDNAGNHFAHVVGGAHIAGDDAVELRGVEARWHRFGHVDIHALHGVQPRHDVAQNGNGVLVIGGNVVGHAGFAAMRIRAAKLRRRDHLPGRGLHNGGSARKIAPWLSGPLPRTMMVSSLIVGT